MSNEDWYARYRFCSMFATCGKSVFFLAEDTLQKTYVLIKRYTQAKGEDIASQSEIFQDEARLFAVLHEKGLVRFFDQHSLDGVRTAVFEVIGGQAISGAPWREIWGGPMKRNGIKPEEVEEEVRKRNN